MTREELNEEIQKEIELEQKQEKRKKIIKKTIKGIFIIILLSILFYSYTTYISTVKIGVREYRIINEKVPTPFNGLKIIQLSDLHYGSTMFQENVKQIKKIVNDRNPDIIVFTGDLIKKNYNISAQEQEELIKELKLMKSTLGKYAILGDEDNEKVATIFNQSEFSILRNDYDLIYKDNSIPLLLIGINSQKKEQDISKSFRYFQQETYNSNIYTITIFHEPDTVEEIVGSYHSDLLIAGHSHNGDIRIPIINKAIRKKAGAQKYDQDFYNIDNTPFYISSGLGTESGIRLFCRPSINFFRISNQ